MKPLQKQKGVFSIEMALIGMAFASIIMFTIDVVIKLSTQGKLDRMAHSLVNIASHKQDFFSGPDKFSTANVEHLRNIVLSSLKRQQGDIVEKNLGLRIETAIITNRSSYLVGSIQSSGLTCGYDIYPSLQDYVSSLIIQADDDSYPTIYSVTICYESNNFVANLLSNGFTTLSSHAVVPKYTNYI